MTNLSRSLPGAMVSVGAVAFGGSLLFTGSVDAGIVVSWTAPAGGDFSVDDNWDLGVPTDADTALFALGGSYSVTLSESLVISRLIVRNGNVTALFESALRVTSPTINLPSIVLGDVPGLSPTLVLVGELEGEYLNLATPAGTAGTLWIESGALLSVSQTLAAGTLGDAVVHVEGTLLAQRLTLGVLAAGSAEMVVTAPKRGIAGGVAINDVLIVAQKGSATVELDSGALLAANEAVLSVDPLSTSEFTLDGPETRFEVAGTLDIGFHGTSTMTVTDGATLSVGGFVNIGTIPASFFFPFWPAGKGVLRIEGPGSTATLGGSLSLPLAGVGALEVRNHGRVEIAGDFVINSPSRATIAVEFEPSRTTPVVAVAGAMLGPTSGTAQCDLLLELPRGFTPTPGQRMTLVEATAIVPPLQPFWPAVAGIVWSLEIETTELVQRYVVRVLDAPDLDGDGVVDGVDLGLLLANWGNLDGSGVGDLDGNGTIDGADLGLLLAAWTPPG